MTKKDDYDIYGQTLTGGVALRKKQSGRLPFIQGSRHLCISAWDLLQSGLKAAERNTAGLADLDEAFKITRRDIFLTKDDLRD